MLQPIRLLLWYGCWILWLPLMGLLEVANILLVLELDIPAQCLIGGVDEIMSYGCIVRDDLYVQLGGVFPEGWHEEHP